MAYAEPNILFSSFDVDIDAYVSNGVDVIEVDRELILHDVISSLYGVIARSLLDLGVELSNDGCYVYELVFDIGDEDVNKVANLNLEIGADELIIDLGSRMYADEIYGGLTPIDLVRLSGSVRIEGFDIVDWPAELFGLSYNSTKGK